MPGLVLLQCQTKNQYPKNQSTILENQKLSKQIQLSRQNQTLPLNKKFFQILRKRGICFLKHCRIHGLRPFSSSVLQNTPSVYKTNSWRPFTFINPSGALLLHHQSNIQIKRPKKNPDSLKTKDYQRNRTLLKPR